MCFLLYLNRAQKTKLGLGLHVCLDPYDFTGENIRKILDQKKKDK